MNILAHFTVLILEFSSLSVYMAAKNNEKVQDCFFDYGYGNYNQFLD